MSRTKKESLTPNKIVEKMENALFDLDDNSIVEGNDLQLFVAEGSAILAQIFCKTKLREY